MSISTSPLLTSFSTLGVPLNVTTFTRPEAAAALTAETTNGASAESYSAMTYLILGFLVSADWTWGWILVATSAIATLMVVTWQAAGHAAWKTSSMPFIMGLVDGTSSIFTTKVSPLAPVLSTTQSSSSRPAFS